MLKLEYLRPTDAENRLPKEMRVYDFLDSLGIEYARVDHEVTATMEACEEIDKILGAPTCKNLFLTNRQGTAFYLLLMPGDKPFKTKDLSAEIGSARLSFGSGERMEELLDITPGSLSVLGLMNDKAGEVSLLIDSELLDNEYIGCHPCINTATLKFKTSDMLEKIIPKTNHTKTVVHLPRYSTSENK